MTRRRVIVALLSIFAVLAIVVPLMAYAQEEAEGVVKYREFFFGISPRAVMWVATELHLLFGAFVLGVPIFAVLIELVGVKTKDPRYDRMAHEFTKLLSAAYATTAALGGVVAFCFMGLYPEFAQYMASVFHKSFYIYVLLFFGETFCLYAYYYSWDRMANHKGYHLLLGLALNIFGFALMFIPNAWATFMMAPAGVDLATGKLLSTWDAMHNHLWNPLNIHRGIANVLFGGLVAGAYAAVKFLGAKTEEDRAHYDWMGYTGNFIGLAALIPLPFAGYFLGREIYSASPVMGNVMMGGAFSWTFIMQAVLVGLMFIVANFYLWIGMDRITGAERYAKYIKYMVVILFFCFAVWLTPHNLPLTGEERNIIGEQYHPLSKYFGVMAAKNAVIQFIILTTFFAFLLYRRGNKGETVRFSQQSKGIKLTLIIGASFGAGLILLYAISLLGNPETVGAMRPFLWPMIICIGIQILAIIGAVVLTFLNRGIHGQMMLFGVTVLIDVVYFAIFGFELMEKANLMLRFLSVTQVAIMLSCIFTNVAIDIAVFAGAKTIGGIAWGKSPARAQYALLILCVMAVVNMALMGYIRAGLRLDWHVYGVLRDTSPHAGPASFSYLGFMTALCTILFLGLVTFVFYLASLSEHKEEHKVVGEIEITEGAVAT